MTLLGQTIRTNAQTRFDPKLQGLAGLHPKQLVTVGANRSGDQLVATVVTEMPPEPEVEGIEEMAAVTGVVSSVDGDVVRLANGGIAIDASKVAKPPLKPGMDILVALKPGAAANKPLPAITIDVARTPDLSMQGTVTAVDAAHGTFTLLGRTIHTDAQTNIRNAAEPRQLFIVLANLHGNEIVAGMVRRWSPELD